MEASDSAQLNHAQRQAVNIKDGPALVVAGAGTGKTKVIVERLLQLLKDGVPANQLLALTFTEKAAGEMQNRVADISLGSALDMTIATYNGFGADLLKMYGGEYGLGSVRLLGETGQLVFLREHFDEFQLEYFAPVSNPDGQLDKLRGYVSLLKQQLVQPDAYEKYAAALPNSDEAEKLEKQKQRELAQFYKTYLELCRAHNVIDYDDQLFLTIELLKARPNVLKTLQARYRYILVDEFQDTNPMQSAFIDLLAGLSPNLMVVGDDDQSIYGWRGATLANILDFKKRYKNAQEITLIENYRSTQPILDAAYRLIQNNNPERLEVINNLDKRLHAQVGSGPAPRARHFTTLDAELNWVAGDIARRLEAGQAASSLAVLARRSQTVAKIHEALTLHGIDHAIAGLTNELYTQPAVRQLVEALKAVADPLDDLALFHTLSGPLFNLPPAELAALATAARREHAQLGKIIKASAATKFQAALQQIEAWRIGSSAQTVGELAYAIIDESGWKNRLYRQAAADTALVKQGQALSQFFRTLKEFERIAGVPSVQHYLLNLPALMAAGSDFEDASLDISDELVNVLSVHRAKGLEWQTVYIVDCTEGSFPLQNRGGQLAVPDALQAVASQADEHLAEERRLMYVAATRAKQELLLSWADRHGSGASRRPSRFLAELLGGEPITDIAQDNQASLELFAPTTTNQSTQTVPLPAAMHDGDKLALSVSQISCWLDCPLDFYYKFVLGIPQPADPRLAYGTAIHAAIEAIHNGRQAGKIPSLEQIVEQVKTALPTTGYATARSRERAHAQALKSVETIYERFASDPLPLLTEQAFGVILPDTPLKIIGRIDAVYQLEQGVEIRDFKTGTSVTTPEQAKSRATGSKQLTLYALAWQLTHDEMPALLSLDFVETGQLGSVKKQAKSLVTMTDKLQTMVEQLQAGNYPPGKDHTFCSHPA